jgi:RNA-directed DNA polymerase
MSLSTPSETVEKLQTSLQTKAKAEPAFRFYALWDKVCRQDVLLEAYRRCRANAGAAGVDGETFARIEAQGLEQWLGVLREELVSGRYKPKPLLRVWIPKSNGGQRPLGIPCISDRVVQMAAVLIIGPIFEADLLPQQYGFRPGLDAKMALRRVYWHVTQHGRREVVDADLRDYFTSIPHAPLMRSLIRRIADGRMLHVIKCWLTAPVVEIIDGRPVQTTEARRTKRGTPQGGVISPLLANCYFRRFLLAWHSHGHRDQLDAHVVNYADDFVICCRPGNAEAAMTRMAKLMARLGLEVKYDQDPDRPIARGTVRLSRLHGRSLPRQGWAPLLRHPPIEEGGEGLAQAYPRADYASVVSGWTCEHRSAHQQHDTRLVRLL